MKSKRKPRDGEGGPKLARPLLCLSVGPQKFVIVLRINRDGEHIFRENSFSLMV
jgi:hypothetical protein